MGDEVEPSGLVPGLYDTLITGALEQGIAAAILAGQRIDNLPSARRDRLRNTDIGMVFQAYHLLPELSALENVLAPLLVRFSIIEWFRRKAEARRQAEALLDRAGPRRFVLTLRLGVGRPFGAVALVGAVDSGPGSDPASGAPSASSSLRRPSSFTPVRLLRRCTHRVCGGRSRALPCWTDQLAGCRAGGDRPGLLR